MAYGQSAYSCDSLSPAYCLLEDQVIKHIISFYALFTLSFAPEFLL